MRTLAFYFLIFILPSTHSFSQSSDSIKISKNDRHVLIGTTVLNASEKNISAAISHGIALDSIKSSECLASGEHFPPPNINSINIQKDLLLVIDINIVDNCSYSFLGEIEILGDTLLNLIYHGYGGYAMCSCCFGLTYYMQIIKDQNFDPDKLKYVTFDNGKEQIKKINWLKN